MKTIRERIQEYVDNCNFDDTHQFTRIIVMLFSFQDAHEETKKSLARCQEKVHELEGKLMDINSHILTWAGELGAKDGDDCIDLIYKKILDIKNVS